MREPLAIRAAIVAAVANLLPLAISLGWLHLTTEQLAYVLGSVNTLSAAVIVVWSRGKVTPVDDPRDVNGAPLTPGVQ